MELAGWLGAAILAAITCFRVALWLRGHPYPAEDAAMLMRYAQNLAGGHGIVFNVGQSPVDGATDMGFMLALAAVIKVGASPGAGVVALDVLAQVATVLVVYGSGRRVAGASIPVSLVAAASIAFGLGPMYIEARFGTPVFALAIAVTWMLAIRYVQSPSRRHFLQYGAAGLVAGIVRPEGVIFFALSFVGLLLPLPRGGRREPIVILASVFVPIGLAYFIWHWAYFGYPLPNPYYRKGGVYPTTLADGFTLLRSWMAPAAVLYLLVLARRWRVGLFHLIPIAGFTLAWAFVSSEANYVDRFQYPLLVIAAVSVPALWQTARDSIARLPVPAWWTLGLVGTLAFSGLWVRADKAAATQAMGRDSRYTVALRLSRLPGVHTMAVTEAGLLPFYSGWTALDLWGLNNENIAHHGLSAQDLTRASPDLVMIHWNPTSTLKGWAQMESLALKWVHEHHYILAADYERAPDQQHLYFVKPVPRDRAIIAAVRIPDYFLGYAPAPDVAPRPTIPGG